MTIYFYGTLVKPYAGFSNFSPHSFDLDGVWWETVEHYFQAQKFPGTPHVEEIRLTRSPMIAKRMGGFPPTPPPPRLGKS